MLMSAVNVHINEVWDVDREATERKRHTMSPTRRDQDQTFAGKLDASLPANQKITLPSVFKTDYLERQTMSLLFVMFCYQRRVHLSAERATLE